MSLDTASKRGSAMLLAMPFRPWLSIPDGTVAAADRLSLLWLGSSLAAGAGVVVTLPPLFGRIAFGPLLAGAIAFKPVLAGEGRITEALAGKAAWKPDQ